MKKRKKIILGVVIVLLVGIGSVTLWQRNNIKAVFMKTRYSATELKTQIAEQDQVIAQAVEKLPGSFHALTKEQEEALKNGDITEQDAINIMTGAVNASSNPPAQGNSGTEATASDTESKTSTPAAAKNDKETQIDDLVAQIYVLRASFMSKLDKLMQSAKAEYTAIPAADRAKQKNKIFLKYAGQANAMESDCDAAVNKILSQLEPLLKDTGGDLSLIDNIKKAYYNEKSLQKAYYIDQYS